MNLLIGKRQIVLAALVVTLSLAVFVNWYYTNGETVIEQESSAETKASADPVGEALFVNADGNEPETEDAAAIVTDGTPAVEGETDVHDVDAPAETTGAPPQSETAASTQAINPQGGESGEYFASARLSRTNAYDESVETLQQIIESNDGNSEAAVKAAQEISEITALLQLETNLEALITAKTGSRCIAVISDEAVNIIVENGKITDEMILGIHGILRDNSLSMENITISGC